MSPKRLQFFLNKKKTAVAATNTIAHQENDTQHQYLSSLCCCVHFFSLSHSLSLFPFFSLSTS